MDAENVSVIYDRKHTADATGFAKVEIRVYFGNGVRKYVTVGNATPGNWRSVAYSDAVVKHVQEFQKIICAMDVMHEEMTKKNFEKHVKELESAKKISIAPKNVYNGVDQNQSFVKYMEQCILQERIAEGTLKIKMVALNAVKAYGKLNRFCDLTPANILGFDKFIKRGGTLKDSSAYDNYHKKLHQYIRQLFMSDEIPFDPYNRVRIPHGSYAERRPLTEQELKKIRDLDLHDKTEKVRDLFIFASYTGLAYCDTQDFDFKYSAEKVGNMYYIDGRRIKTKSNFFTPILKPAMDVLKKYHYKLPKISDQKANDYLHLIEARLNLNKPLTFHVARHSFATLALSHDVPIENVQRMLGHKDVRVTQIYAKVLKTNVERHASRLNDELI